MRLSSKLLSAVLNHRPFYVTTPIFYVNAAPHLGHVYSAVVADAVQRFEKLIDSNINVIFSTGTDEHGTKVQMAASKAGLPPSKYCDKVAEQYKSLFNDFNVDFTDFIRTTEERHTTAVQHFWNELKKNDHLYKAEYSGWYSVNDEMFVPESQIKEEERNGEKVKVSQESGHTVEWTQETNYMFRLSSFRSDLQNWLKEDGVVTPSKFQKLLLEWLHDDYLPDISVSRPSSRVNWAVRVPNDEEQSVYVWLDALVNYITVIGYPDQEQMNARGRPWPADVQIVGKDILKFHGIYWPAFLMAVGMYPPRRLLCHSHWTVDGKKMSKSLGNVVDPRNTPGGLEALRYFLLREGTMHSDANFSEVKLVRTLNAELADSLGNLLQRCTGKSLNPRQEFPQLYSDEFRELLHDEVAQRLLKMVEELPEMCFHYYSDYQFYKVADAVRAVLHAANLFFETQKPWLLKNNPEAQKELDVILHVTMETIRVCAIILQPIIPNMTEKLLNKLDVPKDCRQWVNSEQITWASGLIYETKRIQAENVVLFPRIYREKEVPRLPKQKKATV